MKVELKNSSNMISPGNVLKKAADFVIQKEMAVVFLIFLVFIGYVGYLWYRYVHDYRWSDTQKQEYMSTKNAVDSFNKAKFEKVLDDINARSEAYQKNMDDIQDIFRLKQ